MLLIVERWEAICKNIERLQASSVTARRATMIAVSKGQPVEAIVSLLDAGQRDFGENRVSEALLKWPALKERYPDIRLHLIGQLQTNKVKDALSLFDVIHTVDRESLADVLVKTRSRECGTALKFFIQVNTGEESQKGGVRPDALPGLMQYTQPLLSITGLMCIPPAGDPPAPHFALLRTLAEKYNLSHLSMGMSGDYETALRLGATHVRIGTAIFGERNPKAEI